VGVMAAVAVVETAVPMLRSRKRWVGKRLVRKKAWAR